MSGSPKTTRPENRLADCASPYLQQHANNPVDWYPWGEEALAKAKAEGKPIFLSIGYSTCYWCHVMERDVFENEAIAAKINPWFVCIKVDREERPEIDEIYMVARQLFTKEGGWPNNLFLTPDLEPFYAVGTMASDERYGKWSFPRLAEALHDKWVNARSEVEQSAHASREAIERVLRARAEEMPEHVTLDRGIADNVLAFFAKAQDAKGGGFYGAPKFPHENFLLFLLEDYRTTGSAEALAMVRNACEAMAIGGIFDHVGGGFHRYAVDADWRVPHFEKMLYNQALLARVFTELFAITGEPYHREIAERTLGYVLTGLTDSATGAFYSGLDAETDAVEGAYYVWSEAELAKLLTSDELKLLNECYGRAPVPSFPGHGKVEGEVLYAIKPLPAIAAGKSMDYAALSGALASVNAKLHKARSARKMPGIDTKIIAAWNGLMIDALAHAGAVFAKPEYTEAAKRAADSLLKHVCLANGRLARVFAHGKPMLHAYLEDYAFLIAGLITVHRASGERHYLDEAVRLFDEADALFLDAAHGSYFFTDGEERMLVRIKQAADAAMPSCSAIMVHNMLDIYDATKDDVWLRKAETKLVNYSGNMLKSPAEFSTMTRALLHFLRVRD